MKKTYLSLLLAAIVLSGCNSLPIASDNSKLVSAQTAIEKAKANNAEKCAPAQLAKAVAKLELAKHEMTEHHESAETILGIIHEAKSAANQAIKHTCAHEEPTERSVVTANNKIVLYFALGSSQLTNDAQAILESELDSLKQLETGIRISGHTDTSGAESFNNGLSEKRANAVKQYLIDKGVNSNAIETSAHGENQLLISTDNDVFEPKNRRVEINLP